MQGSQAEEQVLMILMHFLKALSGRGGQFPDPFHLGVTSAQFTFIFASLASLHLGL